LKILLFFFFFSFFSFFPIHFRMRTKVHALPADHELP
jgi:hypothetical protein